MLKHIVVSSMVVLALGFAACDEVPTERPATVDETALDPSFDVSLPPDGGTCPDVFYEESGLLDNGITVTWTSVLAGFEYTEGEDYMADVNWSVDLGSADFVSFTRRNGNNTWTPKRDVAGIMTPGAAAGGTVPVTVSMTPMHEAGDDESDDDDEDDGDESDWAGQIGNGHFWLRLLVDDGEGNVERVKLGVNFHLEDPADGYGANCPGGDPPADPPVDPPADEPVNEAPTANAGDDRTVTDTDDGGDENVTLDGSASTDDDGTIVSWSWSEDLTEIATGEMPTVSFAVGAHTVMLTVTDNHGASDVAFVVITVEAAPPAGISFAADIQPYFEVDLANCVRCHSGGSGPAGVNLDSYSGVIAADPAGRLVPQLEANHHDGPDDAGFVVTFEQWIAEGSHNN
jgi:hypothetical protein